MDPDIIGSRDLRVRNLRFDPYTLQIGTFLWYRQEYKVVLIIQRLLDCLELTPDRARGLVFAG